MNQRISFMKNIALLIGTLFTACLAHAEMKMYFVHNDHLGTPQYLTDMDQNVVWKVESQTPFGEVIVNEDPDGDGEAVEFNLRFAGQYYDEETNSNYNYHRTYDPSLGRYIHSDPIGLNGGINTYAYVLGNPIVNVDPDGLLPVYWYQRNFRNQPNWQPTDASRRAAQAAGAEIFGNLGTYAAWGSAGAASGAGGAWYRSFASPLGYASFAFGTISWGIANTIPERDRDNDNDGIPDWLDEDDDNDNIPDSLDMDPLIFNDQLLDDCYPNQP